MKISLFLILVLCPVLAFATDSNPPLEITADKALEWNQTDKTYTAKGSAEAKQGEMSVKADTLVANYAGANGSTSDINLLTAIGNVVLTNGANIATGDKVIYDLIKDEAILSGTRPKIIQDGKNTLEADKIIVWTKNNILDRAEAIGNVIINNGEQTATGNKAIFTPQINMAELIGTVKIVQGKNILEGDKAEINLTTRVSKMIGQNGSGRVKGVFYTGQNKKEEAKKVSQ